MLEKVVGSVVVVTTLSPCDVTSAYMLATAYTLTVVPPSSLTSTVGVSRPTNRLAIFRQSRLALRDFLRPVTVVSDSSIGYARVS